MKKKYYVEVPYLVWCSTIVDAEDEDEAIDLALGETNLCGYVGNGGTNKLVGPTGNAKIEPADQHYDEPPIDIFVDCLSI